MLPRFQLVDTTRWKVAFLSSFSKGVDVFEECHFAACRHVSTSSRSLCSLIRPPLARCIRLARARGRCLVISIDDVVRVKQASRPSILTCAPPPSPCRSQPAAQTAMPPSASPKMAVRLPSSSRSTACLCSSSSTRRAQVPPLTLPQTFAPSANRRATSIPTCSSKSIPSATTKCASRVWTASSATGPRPVPLRGARGRSERQSSASRLLRI
jgi:hypothetical protein